MEEILDFPGELFLLGKTLVQSMHLMQELTSTSELSFLSGNSLYS